MWVEDLGEVRAALAGLDVERELASAREAAVRWRDVESFSSFFRPWPPMVRGAPELRGAWRDQPDERLREIVGLDAEDRPVAHVLDLGGERPSYLWRWYTDGSFQEIELMGEGPRVRRARVRDGRLAYVTTAAQYGEVGVRLLTWSGPVCVRVDDAFARPGGQVRAEMRAAVLDARGDIEQVLSGQETWEAAPRTSDDELVASLQAALARAKDLAATTLVWDGRVSRLERWPGKAEAEHLVEPLARALEGALRAAAAETGIVDPFALVVTPSFPPGGVLAGTDWRDRMRRANRDDGAAIDHLWRGIESGDVAELDLVHRLDGEALRACRIFASALGRGASSTVQREATEVAGAVGDRLAELLNRTPLEGAADPYLALVHLGELHSGGSPPELALRRAATAAGEFRAQAFQASVTSQAPAAGPRGAVADRSALEGLLRGAGLEAHAHRLAHEVAAEALRLRLADREVRSRLGGPPLLPAGTSWPLTGDGVPLSFLAAIDLSELHLDPLPEAGWLLFFADLGTEEADGLIDEVDNAAGSVARVLYAAPDVEMVPAEAPDALRTSLNPRPVEAERVLTLPDDHDAPQRLGLDVYEAESYEGLLSTLAESGAWTYDHWIGGHVAGVQGYRPEPDTFLLLHLADDAKLGFAFFDLGVIQFRIPLAALAAGDWSQVTAFADSC